MEARTPEGRNLAELPALHHPRQRAGLRNPGGGVGCGGRKLHRQPQQGGRHVSCGSRTPSTTAATAAATTTAAATVDVAAAATGGEEAEVDAGKL